VVNIHVQLETCLLKGTKRRTAVLRLYVVRVSLVPHIIVTLVIP
jgi:hypothetical protein